MGIKRISVAVTADGSGAVTVYTPRFSGRIHQIEYVKPGSGYYDDTVDFAITGEKTGIGLWTEANVTASKVCAPRMPTHSQVGVAATLDGTRPALDRVALGNDRAKIVLAQAGASKTGTFHFLIEN